MYEYRATLVRIIDADTFVMDVDLGFDIHSRITVRLYGINAPERYTDEGKAASAWTWKWFGENGTTVTLNTIKDTKGKFGRYLGVVRSNDPQAPSYNDAIVAAGHAVEAEY